MITLKTPATTTINWDRILGWIVSASAFLFPITVLTVNRADSFILLLLGIIGTYAFLNRGLRKLAFSRREIILILIFAGWYASIVLSYFLGDRTDTGFKMLGRDLRLLFFIPVYIAFLCYLRSPRPLLFGLVLAPIAIFGLALWQFFDTDGITRIRGFVDPIPFGDLSIAMAFMALSYLLAVGQRRRQLSYLFSGGALSAGVATSILSESRGGWIALPVFLLITAFILSRRSARRAMKVLVVCVVFVLISWWLVPSSIIPNRIASALDEFAHYYNFLKLVRRGDVRRQGCLNDRLFITMLADELTAKYSLNLKFEPVQDDTSLEASDFIKGCQSGYAIKATNLSVHKNTTFLVPRSLVAITGEQNVEFLIKGKGMLTIANDHKQVWQTFDNKQYVVIKHKESVKTVSWPFFWIPNGGSIYFVPIQRSIGEYVYPLAGGSVGKRLEMWRAAWHIFLQYPFLGSGTGAYRAELTERARRGEVSPEIMSYDHPHNDYLNALSGQGLVGLLFYLLSIIYPLTQFVGSITSQRIYHRMMGFAGIIMTSGLLIFGLTESMFVHSVVICWYVIFMAMLMSIIFRHSEITENENDGLFRKE